MPRQFNHHPRVKQKHIWFNFIFLLSFLLPPCPLPSPQILPLNLRSQIKCKQLISCHSKAENFRLENFKHEVFLGAIMKMLGGNMERQKKKKRLFLNVLWALSHHINVAEGLY